MGFAPLTAPGASLTPQETQHYGRHLLLPDIGAEGQRRLKSARVLMIGAGGLGSPIGLYLAAAGVGTLGIVEFDRVEASNLHRQVLYSVEQIGQPKLDSAVARLRSLNPHIAVVPHALRLDAHNALELFQQYDLVIDGTDNFPTRYLVNDACVLLGKPFVSAAIYGFEGQLSVFWPGQGPCYRCLYPEAPPPGLVPSCAEGGVLGVLPGIMGSLQANEAIKLLLGLGEPLVGRLLQFDALNMCFQEFSVQRHDSCKRCGPHAEPKALADYEHFCGIAAVDSDITANAVEDMLSDGTPLTLIDVRDPAEWNAMHIDGARHIPLAQLAQHIGRFDTDNAIIVYCQSGIRSRRAVDLLRANGIAGALSMRGGIQAWNGKVNGSTGTPI